MPRSQAWRTVARASSSVTAREQAADRRATEAEAGDREAGPSERHRRDGSNGHGSSLRRLVDADDERSVSSSPRSTGQNAERPGAIVRLMSCRSAAGEILGVVEGERWLPAPTILAGGPRTIAELLGRSDRVALTTSRPRGGDELLLAVGGAGRALPRPSCSPRSRAPARSWRSAATTASTPRRRASSRPAAPLIFAKWPS